MKGLGKLSKFFSFMKKKFISSFTNTTSTTNTTTTITITTTTVPPPEDEEDDGVEHLHRVYVGKTRREYLITTELIEHPLFKVLMDKSDNSLAIEVVMFDHMILTLNTAENPPDIDELIEFYNYA